MRNTRQTDSYQQKIWSHDEKKRDVRIKELLLNVCLLDISLLTPKWLQFWAARGFMSNDVKFSM